MQLTFDNPSSSKGWAMQDKTDAAGYSVSGLAALLGMVTTDFLMVGISAMVGIGTLYISWHFKKLRLKEERRQAQAAIDAEKAREDHYRRRDDDSKPPDSAR